MTMRRLWWWSTANGECGAFRVDRIVERLDLILKPLEGLLAGTPGIMGTTLLGDGGFYWCSISRRCCNDGPGAAGGGIERWSAPVPAKTPRRCCSFCSPTRRHRRLAGVPGALIPRWFKS